MVKDKSVVASSWEMSSLGGMLSDRTVVYGIAVMNK